MISSGKGVGGAIQAQDLGVLKRHPSCGLLRRGRAQQGGVLLVVAVLLAVITASVLVATLRDAIKRNRQTTQTVQQLASDKALVLNALMIGVVGRPGLLMTPDRTFNGNTDQNCLQAGTASGLPARNVWNGVAADPGVLCIGWLPWRDLQSGVAIDGNVIVQGLLTVIVISGNLVDATGVPRLNSDAMLATPPHKWLTVVDAKGGLVSNQVAIVLIRPGKPLGSQRRVVQPDGTPLTRPMLATYLDRLPGVADHTDMSGRFTIAGEVTDSTGQVIFNDQLVYVTAQEWMTLVLTRVAAEIRLAADLAYTTAYPTAMPPVGAAWFQANGWDGVTNYSATGDQITLRFARCGGTWTIQRQGSAGVVSHQGGC
ncbi:hypothetical protein HNQ59_002774 [Chitinivorax tropicus]|uniref:Uncharacterized protein n=1 Tax=Chitinivorax tropicus TaxID=714531 RepID=A0A840MRR3_9PROT|nr:hypothetical protein [Chitinivorax tropicus]MBB5019472.1 hypothetical protein [Chitinivorax tropicus]